MSTGGRPSSKFIEAHFNKIKLQDNRAKKWVVTCKYCSTELIHRDNRCLNHIRNTKECLEAPDTARQQALFVLKNSKKSEEKPSDILWTSEDVEDEEGTSKKKIKLENSKLTSYLEKAIDPKVKAELDLKVLR